MPIVLLDAKGLKCPQPTIQMTIKALKLKKGDVLEAVRCNSKKLRRNEIYAENIDC